MTPWCEAKLMSSEHWGDPRRSYRRREFVMVSYCLIAEHTGLRSSGCQDGRRGACCCRLVAGRISRRQDFLAKVSETVTQCSMCVYLLCWQLAPWSPDHSLSHQEFLSVSSCPKGQLHPQGLPQPAAIWWSGNPRNLSTDQPPQLDKLGSPKSAFSRLVVKRIS